MASAGPWRRPALRPLGFALKRKVARGTASQCLSCHGREWERLFCKWLDTDLISFFQFFPCSVAFCANKALLSRSKPRLCTSLTRPGTEGRAQTPQAPGPWFGTGMDSLGLCVRKIGRQWTETAVRGNTPPPQEMVPPCPVPCWAPLACGLRQPLACFSLALLFLCGGLFWSIPNSLYCFP